MTKTVKVKVAVCVDSKGNWSATGWSSAKNPPEFHSCIREDAADDVIADYWLEAELPLPETPIICPTVTEATQP